MSNKLRGEWAELCFMAAAANHGFRVAKPFGECGRYDTVIERNGVFLRIQVKSTIHRQDGSYICGLRPTSTNPYNEGEIEFWRRTLCRKTCGTSCRSVWWRRWWDRSGCRHIRRGRSTIGIEMHSGCWWRRRARDGRDTEGGGDRSGGKVRDQVSGARFPRLASNERTQIWGATHDQVLGLRS
jgi:hypothetical protein